MDQAVARRTLQELIKREDLGNKKCIDCSNPNPQWASLSFAVFLCLQCAGLHRGYGVHVSFVRSVSMDTWQEDQIKRMQIGGNALFRNFMKTYPTDGGYTEGMNPYDAYHSWAAAQYKEKLDADVAGKSWTMSPKPAGFGAPNNSSNPPSRPSSAQGLRKARASGRTNTGRPIRSDSSSPASFGSASNSPISTPNLSHTPQDQKAANESFFSSLGQANASRSADLPPSQGGRYQGFGNTPTPPPGSSHPSYGLSSAATPTLTDFQENPVAALGKGWSLLSAAVIGASRAVNEGVIQPGMGKVRDPTFQAGVRGYVTEATKRAGDVGRSANEWGKNTLGVDVVRQVGDVVGTVKDKVAGGPERSGYGQVGQTFEGESSALYQDEDDFFAEYAGSAGQQQQQHQSGGSFSSGAQLPSKSTNATTSPAKQENDWDSWNDF